MVTLHSRKLLNVHLQPWCVISTSFHWEKQESLHLQTILCGSYLPLLRVVLVHWALYFLLDDLATLPSQQVSMCLNSF